MIISRKIYDQICSIFYNCQREYGGILGGFEGVTTEFEFDCGIPNKNIGTYIPNTLFLNECISKWQNKNIEFYGIIHNHLTKYAELSDEDIICIETIMNSMPLYINTLYFPVISSKHILNAFKAEKCENGICIISEKILIVEKEV